MTFRYARGRMTELVRRLHHDEGEARDLGLQEPVDGRFGQVILGGVGVFDSQLPGRERRFCERQLDDRCTYFLRYLVPNASRLRRLILKCLQAALNGAPIPVVER